jgi:hypothetical protein
LDFANFKFRVVTKDISMKLPSALQQVSVAVVVLGFASSSANASQKPMTDGYVCEHPPYTVSLVSKSPLVAYLHNFITPGERAHLQEVT